MTHTSVTRARLDPSLGLGAQAARTASSADDDNAGMTDLVQRLRAAGSVFAEEEAALLAGTSTDAAALERLVVRRLAGEPLEHVLGWAEVAGVRVRVAPGVFVPRQRTALLVDLAVAAAPRGATVVDLCCGSGALLAAVRHRRPDVVGHAADIDPHAVACARTNLPHDAVHEGDLYDALPAGLRGRVDVLVVNAPYVPTAEVRHLPPEARLHEPLLALDGGPDGLDVHRRVARDATGWLAPGGTLLVEVAQDQLATALGLLAEAGLTAQPVADDEHGALAVRAVPRDVA